MTREQQAPRSSPPLQLASRRLLLLDLDDTLCDYSTARGRRLRTAFAGGDEPTAPGLCAFDLERMVAASIAVDPDGVEHFPRLFRDFGMTHQDQAERAARWYRRNRFFGLELFPETLRVFARLRATASRPLRLGVVTNGPAAIQRDKAALLGIDRLVDFVLVSGEFGSEKPDRAIFEEALRLGGARADEAVMVGDSLEHDIAGAHRAGIASIWVNPSGRSPEPIGLQPDFVITRLEELVGLLEPESGGSPGC